MSAVPERRWPPLRILVVVVAGIDTLLLVPYFGIMVIAGLSTDPLGRAIGQGMALLTAVPLFVFAAPALILGVVNRWLPVALVLALLAMPVGIFLFYSA